MGSVQNTTIEERVTILENQVVVIQDDVTDLEGDVFGLDQDVNFLFEEQVIQDERLLGLEQTSVEVIVELAEINVNIEGRKKCVPYLCRGIGIVIQCIISFAHRY